jgi:hypothetical protein
MLFIDREPITLADLESIEPNISSVCDTERIAVTGENSIIRNAVGECANRIITAMTAYESYPSDGDMSGNHLAAVLNVYGTRNMPRVHLAQICMNPRIPGIWSPLKQWLGHYALERIFRAAWNRKVTDKGRDKYAEKAEAFADAAAGSWGEVRAAGLPIVWNPLSAPGAVLEENSGTFTAANLSAVAGAGTETGGSFTVQITWVDVQQYRTPTDRNNAESHPTEALTKVAAAGEVLSIDITSLNPPAGFDFQRNGYSQGIHFPRIASGWNIYVNGVLQNAVPVPAATKTYTLASDPQTVGYRVGNGQYPNVYAVMPAGIPIFRA